MVWMIEGEWTGYNSSQRRVRHRHYTTRRAEAESISNLGFIRFTDGTSLILSVKQLTARRKLPAINGYGSLINSCRFAGVNSVEDLHKKPVEVSA